MIFHCVGVGLIVIKYRSVGGNPGNAAVFRFQAVKIGVALVAHRLSRQQRLGFELILLHLGKIGIQDAQDQYQAGQQHRQRHQADGAKNTFRHTVSSNR